MPVFGPANMKKLGKPAMVVPQNADIPTPEESQCSLSVRPSAPTTRSANGFLVVRNPVP